MISWKRARLALAAVASVAAVGATLVPASAGASGNAHVSTVPGWVGQSRDAGAAPASEHVYAAVWLRLRDAAGLAALDAAVSDPASASYRDFISSAEFHSRFSPAQQTVDSITRYLQGYGITVAEVPANRLYIAIEGSVSQMAAAFGTRLDRFDYRGQIRRAPVSAPSMPAALASSVAAVTGLSTGDAVAQPDHITSDGGTAAPAAYIPGRPCNDWWAEQMATAQPPAYGQTQPYALCGYTGTQLESAYGVSGAIAKGIDGRGHTLAIVDAYAWDLIVSDSNTYFSNHGIPTFGQGQFTQLLPSKFIPPKVNGCQTPDDWSGEEVLDVQSSHSMAPGADIVYSAGADCSDQSLLAAENRVIDGQLAGNISNSWGGVGDINQLPADVQQAYEETFSQAVAEGIGVFFSSGDSGDEVANTGTRQVDYPASDPLVTAVGGTSLAVGQSGNYLFETGWSTASSSLSSGAWSPAPPGNYLYGAGGGTSQVFAEPSYQQGVVPSSISGYWGGGFNGRAVPDIAALADPNTGFLYGQTMKFPTGGSHYAESRIGGTSLACPLMVGIETLADQVGGDHGFANPAIYRLYKTSALRDVAPQSTQVAVVRANYVNGVDASNGVAYVLRSMDIPTTIYTRKGYDDVTGVGTPDGTAYLRNLGH